MASGVKRFRETPSPGESVAKIPRSSSSSSATTSINPLFFHQFDHWREWKNAIQQLHDGDTLTLGPLIFSLVDFTTLARRSVPDGKENALSTLASLVVKADLLCDRHILSSSFDAMDLVVTVENSLMDFRTPPTLRVVVVARLGLVGGKSALMVEMICAPRRATEDPASVAIDELLLALSLMIQYVKTRYAVTAVVLVGEPLAQWTTRFLGLSLIPCRPPQPHCYDTLTLDDREPFRLLSDRLRMKFPLRDFSPKLIKSHSVGGPLSEEDKFLDQWDAAWWTLSSGHPLDVANLRFTLYDGSDLDPERMSAVRSAILSQRGALCRRSAYEVPQSYVAHAVSTAELIGTIEHLNWVGNPMSLIGVVLAKPWFDSSSDRPPSLEIKLLCTNQNLLEARGLPLNLGKALVCLMTAYAQRRHGITQSFLECGTDNLLPYYESLGFERRTACPAHPSPSFVSSPPEPLQSMWMATCESSPSKRQRCLDVGKTMYKGLRERGWQTIVLSHPPPTPLSSSPSLGGGSGK